MKITMQEICKFAYAQPNSKNFIGGENLINRGHVLNCGKINDDNSNSYQIFAFCLQTTNLKSTPHEITGEILNNGQIVKMECTCKAGLGSACKHIMAVLLYCNRNDLETLQIISCTDKKCVWNVPQKSVLEKYEMQPLYMHNCFLSKKIKSTKSKPKNQEMTNKSKNTELLQSEKPDKYQMEEQEKLFRQLMIEGNPSLALAKHL